MVKQGHDSVGRLPSLSADSESTQRLTPRRLHCLALRAMADARGVPFVVATRNRDDMWDGFRDRAVVRKPFKYDELVEILMRFLPG